LTLAALKVIASIDPGLIALVVALIAPLGAYLVTVRRLSGRIKNSEATELWAESRSIRDWSAARIKELDDEISNMEKRLRSLEEKNSELVLENRLIIQDKYRLQGLLEKERAFKARLRWDAERSPRRRSTDSFLIEEETGEW
jgi:hypothetical protein